MHSYNVMHMNKMPDDVFVDCKSAITTQIIVTGLGSSMAMMSYHDKTPYPTILVVVP